jgi:hypothetical protein
MPVVYRKQPPIFTLSERHINATRPQISERARKLLKVGRGLFDREEAEFIVRR